jgi:nucleotide-binding universal stress UspA family protein
MRAAEDADLLVVGNRGRGGFAGLLAGSVSVQLATQAPGPLVVVRGRAGVVLGPVVVGVDLPSPAGDTIAIGFDQAARRGCALRVVHGHSVPAPPWTVGLPPLGYDAAVVRADLRRDLAAQVAPWREKYPDVPVDCTVSQGSPAQVLTSESRQAQLVVVGTRNRGRTGAMLLGSVGLQLLHHTDCPVLIARVPHHD